MQITPVCGGGGVGNRAEKGRGRVRGAVAIKEIQRLCACVSVMGGGCYGSVEVELEVPTEAEDIRERERGRE